MAQSVPLVAKLSFILKYDDSLYIMNASVKSVARMSQ